MGALNKLSFLLLTAVGPLATVSPAQEPAATPSPTARADVAALRARIVRLPAAPVAATPAAPGEPETTPVLRAQLEEPRLMTRRLNLREVRFVPLPAEDEAKTKNAVVQQIQEQEGGHWLSLPSTSGQQVAVFDGAIRTLATDSAELTLKAIALARSPLRYKPSLRLFEGTVSVGVVDLGRGGATRKLSEPIVFQVIGPVDATPEVTRAEDTAPPYQNITVSSASVDAPVDLQIVSNVTPEGVKLTLLVDPALIVRVTPSQIQGWGLETADVLVQARGLGPDANREVQLSADRGILTPTELTLSNRGTGASSIRSVSTGASAVTVSGPAFIDATAPVEFVFPARFLAAGLLGGLAGGLVRVGSQRRPRRRAAEKVGLAVLCGAIVFALYALGVNLTGLDLPARAGELVVFAVAALGALWGAGLLKHPLAS